jgi:hypothetical protein
MFKVSLSKPIPEGVSVSSKNVCIVTIVEEDDGAMNDD